MDGNMTEKIILYGHPGCLMVNPVRMLLENSRADYDYINIYQDDEARSIVKGVNHGNESVPTLVFPDGSTLTEPSNKILIEKLIALGYQPPRFAMVMAHFMSGLMLLLQVAPLLLLLYLVLEVVGIF
jgi:mycoredoxin